MSDQSPHGSEPVSQPKSIGDDAQFLALLKLVSRAIEPSQEEFFISKLVELIDSRAPAAQASATIQAASDADELKFNAQRLRNVALIVGLAGAIPDDDATLDGARGAVLGMIAGRLRGEAKIDALAAPMVADPAGVALATLKRYPDSAGPGRGEMFRVADVEALFAAPLADKTGGGEKS